MSGLEFNYTTVMYYYGVDSTFFFFLFSLLSCFNTLGSFKIQEIVRKKTVFVDGLSYNTRISDM